MYSDPQRQISRQPRTGKCTKRTNFTGERLQNATEHCIPEQSSQILTEINNTDPQKTKLTLSNIKKLPDRQSSRQIQPVIRGEISLYAARYKTFKKYLKKIINEWRYLPCFKSRNNMFKLVNSHLINLQKRIFHFHLTLMWGAGYHSMTSKKQKFEKNTTPII